MLLIASNLVVGTYFISYPLFPISTHHPQAENISTLDFGCVVNNVNFMPILKLDPKRCVKCAAVGRQRIVKFRKPVLPGTVASVVTDGDTNSRGDDVIILMCIVRLLDVLTDILITLNVPFIADGTGEGNTFPFHIHSFNQSTIFQHVHSFNILFMADLMYWTLA